MQLTPTMNERNHLILELDKLEFTRNYLQDDDENLEFVELN